MITSFTVNREAASSVIGQSGITKTGMYIGTICQCEIADSQSGATYVEFIFKATNWKTKTAAGAVVEGSGSLTSAIRMYITSAKGEETYQRKIIDALMVVLGIETITPQDGTVFSPSFKRDGKKYQGKRLMEFEKKTVGFLLQRENDCFQNAQGETKENFRLNLVTPFDAATKKSAKEILENSDASAVENRFTTLTDYDSKRLQAHRAAQAAPASIPAPDSFDESDPF